LKPGEADDDTLGQLAQYIIDVAGPLLESEESAAAVERLAFMVRENTQNEWERVVRPHDPSYGDGRMAPHEWLITTEGRLFKTDAFAHALDHTVVGRQSILWDVAGVIVEWELAPEQRRQFANALKLRGREFEDEEVRSYVQAYAAFRMGFMTLCAESAWGQEQANLRAAAEKYRCYVRASRAPAIA
jgi:hypothetical protein